MKKIFYMALFTTALSLPAAYSLAQSSTSSSSSTGGSMGSTGTTGSSMDSGTGMDSGMNTDTTGTMNNTTGTTGTSGMSATDTTTGMDPATGDTSVSGTTSSSASTTMSNVPVNNLDPATVRRIQTALQQNGFSPGPIDGIWGARTTSSLQLFQQAQGISPTRSGIIPTETLGALGIGLNEIRPAAGMGATPGSPVQDMNNNMSGRVDDSMDENSMDNDMLENGNTMGQ